MINFTKTPSREGGILSIIYSRPETSDIIREYNGGSAKTTDAPVPNAFFCVHFNRPKITMMIMVPARAYQKKDEGKFPPILRV
jgi:hypothetical protein